MREYSQYKDTEFPYSVDFSSSATDRGTTVSSVAWSNTGGNLTVSNQALASGIASADVSGSTAGCSVLKLVATYADGNTESAYITITIQDPEYNYD